VADATDMSSMRLFGRIQHEFGLRHSKRIKYVPFRNLKEFLA